MMADLKHFYGTKATAEERMKMSQVLWLSFYHPQRSVKIIMPQCCVAIVRAKIKIGHIFWPIMSLKSDYMLNTVILKFFENGALSAYSFHHAGENQIRVKKLMHDFVSMTLLNALKIVELLY